ncbi:MAG: hypothetical protein JW908_11460 [Anaerolineales bacterium]|nr:hypothetical protein [Anaerolineales bacterium]
MIPIDKHSIEFVLEECLDRLLNGQETIEIILDSYPTLSDELRPRLEAALWLTAQKANIQPRPEFVRASSQRLMARIQSEQRIQKQTRQPGLSFWQNLFTSKKMAFQVALVAVLVFSTLLFGSTVTLAAQNAVPGEALYPVKTSLETVQLAITTSPLKEAQLHLQFADHRLVEMQTLSALEDYDHFDVVVSNMDNHVDQALQALQNQAIKDPIQTKEFAMEMRRSLSRHEQTLAYIKAKAPSKNQAALNHAVEISSRAMGVAENVISTGNPVVTASVTATDTPVITLTLTPLPSETPVVTTIILAPPPSVLMASETLEPTEQATSTTKIKKTPKPTNTNKPTQKPTKTPKPAKPTKTPKPDKPTKTPKD